MGTLLTKEADQASNAQSARDEYKKMSRGKFKELFAEFEFRCERAAVINYKKSSDYDSLSRYMEYTAFFLGSLSVALTGMWGLGKLREPASRVGTMLKRLKAPSFVGVGFSILLEILAKGDLPRSIMPTFSVRAEKHNAAGAAWQTLAHTARAHLILIEDPELGPNDFSEWYQDLAKKREKVCTIAVIPATEYKEANGDDLFDILIKKRETFAKYQEIKRRKTTESDDATKA